MQTIIKGPASSMCGRLGSLATHGSQAGCNGRQTCVVAGTEHGAWYSARPAATSKFVKVGGKCKRPCCARTERTSVSDDAGSGGGWRPSGWMSGERAGQSRRGRTGGAAPHAPPSRLTAPRPREAPACGGYPPCDTASHPRRLGSTRAGSAERVAAGAPDPPHPVEQGLEPTTPARSGRPKHKASESESAGRRPRRGPAGLGSRRRTERSVRP
jgi:hypothetical protein